MANFTPNLKPYSGQGKFRYWVQMVLPTIYDDSLSYMELLNKVVYVINLAIEDIDTVEENVAALLTAFEELQQFTNDYFENLDVQEEINNKLDKMAMDGSLDALLEPYISTIITNWLDEHITPTTPIIDDTLTISGAAADSKTVGDLIKPMYKQSYNLLGVNYINANIVNGEIVPITSGNNNFALEKFIPIPNDVTTITLSGTANRGNTTVYIHEYTNNEASKETRFISKKVNNFPQVINLETTTKFIRINGYLAGGSYVTAIPNNFMLIYGNINKNYIEPNILNDDFAVEYSKNYEIVKPKLVNTHSTRQEYSNLYCCTPINEKILLNDEITIFAPSNLRVAYQIFEGKYDQKSDKIFDSGWKYSPITIPNTYKDKYVMLVCSYNPATSITPDIADEITMYIKLNNTGILNVYNQQVDKNKENIITSNTNDIYKSIAHRGLQKISPECTGISYINCKAAGFKYAENDLFKSLDNVFVMWHDPTLNKLGNLTSVEGYDLFKEETTENIVFYDAANDVYYILDNDNEYTPYTPTNNVNKMIGYNYSVSDLNYNILYKIDFGKYKGGEYIGEHILTFDEFILLCRNLGLFVYLDRKIVYDDANLTQIADIINKYGMQKKTYFIGGFTPTTIETLFEKLPYIPGFISLAFPTAENIENFEAHGCNNNNLIFMPDGKQITEADGTTIKNASAKGYETQMYYVDYTLKKETLIDTLYQLTLYGINGITTDNFTYTDIVEKFI